MTQPTSLGESVVQKEIQAQAQNNGVAANITHTQPLWLPAELTYRCPLHCAFWQILIDRFERRKEKVRTVVAHFMKVHMHLRLPLLIDGDTRPTLLLCEPRPIAVEVEEIMICPARRPVFIMLCRVLILNGTQPATCGLKIHITFMSIRI